MQVLFIRHAAAEDKAGYRGRDHARPLSADGRKQAKVAFNGLARIFGKLDLIVSSEAVRARETAEILSQAFARVPVTESSLLNPGANHPAFVKVLRKLCGDRETVALVGHDPDFSRILAAVVADGHLRIEVKKASCVAADVNSLGKGELKLVLPPGAVAALASQED